MNNQEEIYSEYPNIVKSYLLEMRKIILDTAKKEKDVGAIEEVLRWGQPTFLTTESKSGTMIRIDRYKKQDDKVAIFFHCQTQIIKMITLKYGKKLTYDGNRGIVFDIKKPLPKRVIKDCAHLALRYNLIKTIS
ncbi:MAG: hypothetical protein ACJAS4_000860 [Bacteriovoracaceae bacterium]|jgi:hypothetical protein